MIKPSDKVLIGWITLLATFASANLGQVGASELNATNPEPSASESILAAEPLNTQGADDQAAVAAHVQNTAPGNGIQSPEVSAPSSPEVVVEADVPFHDTSAATLEPLVATAQPPLPVASEPADVVADTGTE